jgi:hypothetical protein
MSTYFKYPRTPHLPWSPGATSDDVRLIDTNYFAQQTVVITEKMDGENTTLYRDHLHARSIDSRQHPSRTWLKQWHQQFAHEIPIAWRICGENLYAKHSLVYTDLLSYFYGFSIWNQDNVCLAWDESCEWFELLGIQHPKVIYQGIWDATLCQNLLLDTEHMEGYVVRLAARFHYQDFAHSVAKWVRAQHVQTDQHWMFAELIPNRLKDTGHE